MNGDKEILYNMISREVYNLIGNISPALRVFSDVISKYLIMYIDPYVDAFFMGTETLNTDVAKEYINKEVNDRLSAFINNFKKAKENNLSDGL